MQPERCCEVSWEVCNKVGGIYTVVSSKAQRMVEQYGDGYFAIGPYKNTRTFEERHPPEHLHAVFDTLRKEGIDCHYGTWHIKGTPQAILIDITGFSKHTNGIKRYLWDTYQIDTLGTDWNDIDEVLIWGWAAGKLVEQLATVKTVCHCHEWLASGALLYLASHKLPIGTVFTTHATTLGRALASEGVLYDVLDHVDADAEAAKRGTSVNAKHALEKVSAREAHVFTTVSEITGMEAQHILGRAPDVLLPNGLDLARYPSFTSILKTHTQARDRILTFLRERFSQAFPSETTRILFLSGREEVHDKGMDVFIEALRQLETRLEHITVAVFFWVPARTGGVLAHGPCTHELEPNDALLQRLKSAGLLNAQHIKIVYYPIYLSETDGLLNLSYDDALQGTQLGVFPSYYEPWGYTPLEAAAYGVPSITTDLAGFGRFIQPKLGTRNPGIFIVPRWKRSDHDAATSLAKLLYSYVHLSDRALAENQSAAHALAAYADWKSFIHPYIDAERRALLRSLK